MEKQDIKIVDNEDTNFVWLLVTEKAKKVFNSGLFDLYALYEDESESLIESMEVLNKALENGLEIGIEVGDVEKPKPTPESLNNKAMELALRTLKSQMEDRKDFKNDLYLSVINNVLEDTNDSAVTYYLFGSEPCQLLLHENFEAVREFCEEDGGFSIFKFTEGETSSVDFVNAYNGWSEYCLINKEEYETLSNL